MTLASTRLAHQRLAGPPFDTPQQAVAWLGAVQAQDYPGAKWSLGLRVRGATGASIEQAFNAGEILRTHILRPTWHFVAPEDLRWMQALTAPRVRLVLAYGDRLNEVDASLRSRSQEVFAQALEGGRALTRKELGQALARAGIQAGGQRLAHLIMHAELDALLCSGPLRGKQFTYMLVDDRAPAAQTAISGRDEDLAWLARRYFSSHGPASARDFAWWSGLTLSDARLAIGLVAPALAYIDIDGETLLQAQDPPPPAAILNRAKDLASAGGSPAAYLLPTFDEFFVGYAGFDRLRRGGPDAPGDLRFESSLLLDGRVIGSWRRTLKKDAVVIELAPFAPLSPSAQAAVEAAARRYGDFLGLKLVLTLV